MSTDYKTLRRVLDLEMEGTKRKRVLATIAAYLDEGYEPSLREIGQRANVGDWLKTQHLVRALQKAGLLEVQWLSQPSRKRTADRLHYKITLP